MNIIEQETLKDLIANPQTENESLLVERLKELQTALVYTEEVLSYENELGLIHDTESAKEDLGKVKQSLALVRPLVKQVDDEWFNGPNAEDMPDKENNPLEWLCVELANLEQDDHCHADYALQFAERAIDKTDVAHSYAFNALN